MGLLSFPDERPCSSSVGFAFCSHLLLLSGQAKIVEVVTEGFLGAAATQYWNRVEVGVPDCQQCLRWGWEGGYASPSRWGRGLSAGRTRTCPS